MEQIDKKMYYSIVKTVDKLQIISFGLYLE